MRYATFCENSYWERTDSFERKIKQMKVAWEKSDLHLAPAVQVALEDAWRPREVPRLASSGSRRGKSRLCRSLSFASGGPRKQQSFLVPYGYPEAELPKDPFDLRVVREGCRRGIENDGCKALTSRQIGQLEPLAFEREHRPEFFADRRGRRGGPRTA